MTQKLAKIVILILETMRKKLQLNNDNKHTNVGLLFEISGPSKSNAIGSSPKEFRLWRLTGEDDVFLLVAFFFLGVLTSSVLMVSDPLRLIECTSLSSRTWPFGTIFLGLDDVDIVAMS